MWDKNDIKEALKGMEYELAGLIMEFDKFTDMGAYAEHGISWDKNGIYVDGMICIETPNPRLAYIKIVRHCLDIIEEVDSFAFASYYVKRGQNYNNIRIKHGIVLGGEGFGYEWDGKKYLKFSSVGGVIIGANVDIGANTCIDRGTLGNTIIGNGVKIDNLCHIAHNVVIENDVMITAGCIIGGSARICRRAYLGIGAKIKNGITIGEGAVIGMGAVVLKDVPAGETWVGNPAKKLK